MINNIDEKSHIASMMSQTLEILDMIDNSKSGEVRVIINPDLETNDGSFLLQGGLMTGMMKYIRESLLTRLTELEVSYMALRRETKLGE